MVVNGQFLEGIIMSVINENKTGAYGYEIASKVMPVLNISESTVYSTCNRLAKRGDLLATREMEVVDGRLRKNYVVTDAGCNKLVSLKQKYSREKKALDQWLYIAE